MKTTHKISITTGAVSGLTTAVLLVGAVMKWDLTDKVAMVAGVLALLVNAMFAVITTVKLPPKVEKVVTEIANDTKTIEDGVQEAVSAGNVPDVTKNDSVSTGEKAPAAAPETSEK